MTADELYAIKRDCELVLLATAILAYLDDGSIDKVRLRTLAERTLADVPRPRPRP